MPLHLQKFAGILLGRHATSPAAWGPTTTGYVCVVFYYTHTLKSPTITRTSVPDNTSYLIRYLLTVFRRTFQAALTNSSLTST